MILIKKLHWLNIVKCKHRIDFGNFEILNYSIDYDKRKFLESLYINSTKNSINTKIEMFFQKYIKVS